MAKTKQKETIKWVERKVAVSDLVEFDKNPRKISDSDFKRLVADLEANGYHQRIIATPDLRVIGGHQRKKALEQLGVSEIEVLVPDREISDKKFRELLIKDNLPFGEFDFEALADPANWDIEELTEWGMPEDWLAEIPQSPTEGLTDDDAVPEPPANPASVLGDIWLLGNHRLMCGDSTSIDAVEKLMDGQKADMVFTDPPYGVSYADKNKYLNTIARGNRIQDEIANDHMNLEDTSDFILSAFTSIKSILAKRSSYYITAPQGGDLMMMMMMRRAGLPLRHTLIWAKNNHVLGRTDYNYKHEPILYGWCDVHDFYGKGNHKFSLWEIDKPLKNDLHPTMKPVELIENAILNSTKIKQIVADIFLGSGSTLIACEKTERICYGMELSPVYCDVIIKRWQEFTGKEAIHAETGESFQILEEKRTNTERLAAG